LLCESAYSKILISTIVDSMDYQYNKYAYSKILISTIVDLASSIIRSSAYSKILISTIVDCYFGNAKYIKLTQKF